MHRKTAAAWMAVLMAVAALAGCADPGYSQASPEAVIQTARRMVENGDTGRLPELIYAESKEMRAVLKELGAVTARLQELAAVINTAFPDEVAALREQAEQAARSGRAGSFMARLTGARSARGRRAGSSGQDPQDAFYALFRQVLSDPYGWLAQSEERITTVELADDRAAVLWDGKPVLAPLGLTMQEEGGKWYIVLPLAVPGIPSLLPKTKEGWEVLALMPRVIDNALADLIKDIRTGKAGSLEDVSRLAGENAFIPGMMVMFAYGKLMSEEREQARATSPSASRSPR